LPTLNAVTSIAHLLASVLLGGFVAGLIYIHLMAGPYILEEGNSTRPKSQQENVETPTAKTYADGPAA
jgi:hypothetical protein